MDIRIVKGGPEDLERFAALLSKVWQEMPNKDWFYLDSTGEYQKWMDRGRMHLWLAMDGDVVAGALDILLPGLHRDNYGYLLDLPPARLNQVVNMDAAAVHPDYRGRGIQRKLMQTAESWLGQEEDRILLCTIHPDNRFSLQNALNQGYEIQRQIPIYGSIRYLLKKQAQYKIKKKTINEQIHNLNNFRRSINANNCNSSLESVGADIIRPCGTIPKCRIY